MPANTPNRVDFPDRDRDPFSAHDRKRNSAQDGQISTIQSLFPLDIIGFYHIFDLHNVLFFCMTYPGSIRGSQQ